MPLRINLLRHGKGEHLSFRCHTRWPSVAPQASDPLYRHQKGWAGCIGILRSDSKETLGQEAKNTLVFPSCSCLLPAVEARGGVNCQAKRMWGAHVAVPSPCRRQQSEHLRAPPWIPTLEGSEALGGEMAREGPAKDWRSQLSTPSPTAGFPPELEEGQSLNRNQLRIIWYETF